MTDASHGTTKDTKDTLGMEDTKARKALACGCEVEASRDFLGRVVGKVFTRGETCPHALHTVGAVIVMPGREHARLE